MTPKASGNAQKTTPKAPGIGKKHTCRWKAGGNRAVARAWRGHGAGYRHFLAWGGAGVARAWRGRGAGISCSPRPGPGTRPGLARVVYNFDQGWGGGV
eukprot:gene13043-biopygen11041